MMRTIKISKQQQQQIIHQHNHNNNNTSNYPSKYSNESISVLAYFHCGGYCFYCSGDNKNSNKIKEELFSSCLYYAPNKTS